MNVNENLFDEAMAALAEREAVFDRALSTTESDAELAEKLAPFERGGMWAYAPAQERQRAEAEIRNQHARPGCGHSVPPAGPRRKGPDDARARNRSTVDGTFGFIGPARGGPDLFVHYSDIRSDGFRRLVPGEEVWFERDMDDRDRPIAVSVEKRYS